MANGAGAPAPLLAQAPLRQQWPMPATGCALSGGPAAAVLRRTRLCAEVLRPSLRAGAPAVHLQRRCSQPSGVLAGQGLLAAPGSHALLLLNALLLHALLSVLTPAPAVRRAARLHVPLML
jgi:hypothetical protein